LSSISNAHVEFATSMVSFERVFEVLDIPVEIRDKPDAIMLPDVTGSITFHDVTFSYTEGGDGGSALLGLGIDRHSKDYDATAPKQFRKRAAPKPWSR
jgi:ATP-binding cassette subfamily B protein